MLLFEVTSRTYCQLYLCAAELYLNSCKFDSAYACIQEAASYNPVSHAVSYMVCGHLVARAVALATGWTGMGICSEKKMTIG